MDYYTNDHPKILRHNRLNFRPDGIDGSIRDLIMLCYEAMDDAQYNRFRIMITQNGTPALEFYDGLISTQRYRTDEAEEKRSWIKSLFKKG